MDIIRVGGLANLLEQLWAQVGLEGDVPRETEDSLCRTKTEKKPGAPEHHKGAGRAKPAVPEQYAKKLLMILRDVHRGIRLTDVCDVQDLGEPKRNQELGY